MEENIIKSIMKSIKECPKIVGVLDHKLLFDTIISEAVYEFNNSISDGNDISKIKELCHGLSNELEQIRNYIYKDNIEGID